LRSATVADTGVVYAAFDARDPNHPACASLLSAGPAVVIPAPVIVEVDWIACSRGHPKATSTLLASVLDGSLLVASLDAEDYARIRHLVELYSDLPLGVVDASVVVTAERLEQDTIATLDRRHFSVVRPLHVDAFTLVP
jgi:predicted nucleic acid-binding protein